MGETVCPSCGAQSDGTARTCSACGRALGPPPSVGPGSLIASRYEIQAHLGSGGMGAVFRAHDRALDETVAIKVLRAGALNPDTTPNNELERRLDIARRFRSEVKLAWKVRHKNVCGIHEYGEDNGLLYISMELVEGRDLRRLLHKNGAFLWEEGYDIALQTADGLRAIHDAGVIHRDLKPANIMKDTRGVVRLMDFGIAKVWQADSDSGITGFGRTVGTPEYMSPEQVRGGQLDFRSDIYALGVVIYEVFTGRPPFRGETPAATMLKHLEETLPLDGPEAVQIPATLLPVLRKTLAKKVADRYRSCGELAAALQEGYEALRCQATDSAALIPPSQKAPRGDELPGHRAPRDAGPPPPSPAASLEAPEPEPQLAPSEARLLLPTLLRGLKHAERDVRVGAAEALGGIGPDAKAAVPSLIDALRDETPEVRAQAAVALGLLGAEARAALSPLVAARGDDDARVQVAVGDAIRRLGPAANGLASSERARPLLAAGAEPPLRRAGAPVTPAPSPVTGADGQVRTGGGSSDEPAPEVGPAGPSGAAPPPSIAAIAPEATWDPDASARPTPRVPGSAQRGIQLAAAAGAAALAVLVAAGLWTVRDRGIDPEAGHATPPQEDLPGATAEASPDPAAVTPLPSAPPMTPGPATPTPPSTLATPVPGPTPSARAPSPAPSVSVPTPAVAPATPAPPAPAPAPSTPPSTATQAIPAPTPTPLPKTPPTTLAPVRPGTLVLLDDPGVVAPEAKLTPAPAYPSVAMRLGVEGTVELRVLVDENGAVVRAEVVRGRKHLDAAAVAGVESWSYRPATKDGVPVKVWIPVTVRFELSE